MRALRFRLLIPPAILVAVVLLSTVAGAQTPAPGEQPELVREWTWWMSLPVLAGAFGLAFLIILSYLRLSTRFYGKEEAPQPRPRPQYAGVDAPAYPAPVQPQAPAQAPAQAQAPQPAAEPAQPAGAAQATATAERPAPEKPPEEPPEETAQEPREPGKAEEPAAAREPKAEEPSAAEEPKAEEGPKEEAEPAAAGSDDDVYERVLKEQLDKGVSPKVAEGRAKAAAVKAKRQQGGE